MFEKRIFLTNFMYIFGLSTESMDLWIHLRSSVRLSIRSSVHCAHFPENPRIRIEVLKMKKISKNVTFSLFDRKFENGPFLAKIGLFGPKGPKWVFLAFFPKLRIGIS